jgi:SAM-dependent methyltransferase
MSFDRLAPHYRWMEAVLAGPRLQRVRTTWLDALAGRRHLVIAGAGHAPELAVLLQAHPALRITCVDASAGMLRAARARAVEAGADLSRVALVHARLPGWQPAERFDAVATPFFLDCFPPAELREVVAHLAALATPDACWLLSEFAIPAEGWRRWRACAVHALMYVFFRVATRLPARRLTPPDEFLAAAGFHLASRRTSEWGLLQADLWTRRPSA